MALFLGHFHGRREQGHRVETAMAEMIVVVTVAVVLVVVLMIVEMR